MFQIAHGYSHLDAVKELFAEYTSMLVSIDPSFSVYLSIQHYDEEAEDLSVKYALPDGRLYLALSDGEAAGCIALRRLEAENCELKRLFVRPRYRGQGIASALLERIISDAGAAGYRSIYLDSVPELRSALALYRKYGFVDTAPYNDSPVDRTVFMVNDSTL